MSTLQTKSRTALPDFVIEQLGDKRLAALRQALPHAASQQIDDTAAPASKPKPSDDRLGKALDIRQVAVLIGCSPWTVRQSLIPRGLPHFRVRNMGRLTFYRDQVIRWIESEQKGRRV